MKPALFAAVIGMLVSGLPAWAQNPTALPDLLAEGARNSSDILAAEHAWRAATHVRDQVTALPDPQLTVQEFSVGSPRPFAGFTNSNFAYIGIGASQQLLYPGKLTLKGQVADRAADVQQARISMARSSVADQIKAAYLRLAYLQQTLILLESSLTTLGEVIESELVRYRTGGGSQADVLKAQIERTNVVREVTMHREAMAEAQADLKRLLHRSQDSSDIVAQTLTLTALKYSARELLDLVRKQNPDVRFERSAIEKQQAELKSAARAGKPDFSIGYMYERTGENFPAYYMLTFGVVLPRRRRVRAEVAEAAEALMGAQERLDAQLQQQLSEVQKQYVAATSTVEILKEYREGMIPQADARFHAVLAEYESNRQQIESVLNSLNEVLELKQEYEQALLDHETAVARLETLTGATLR